MTKQVQKVISIITLVVLLSVKTSFGQEISEPKTLEELKEKLQSEMKIHHVAGMSLVIINKDSVIQAGGLGIADVENNIQVDGEHLFRQASITKLFTALGILVMVNDGKLSLKTPLKKIAPEIPFRNKWEKSNPVTIAQLMEHTSGFSDKSPFEEYNFSGKKLTGTDAISIFNKYLDSKWKPGERHSYSGINYAILAYIIEKISGTKFNDYMHSKVFLPLGMDYANVFLSPEGSGNYCKGYVWKNNRYQLVPHQAQYNAGYGSLNASALDLASVLKAYLNNWLISSSQFLSKEIMEDSEIPHTYYSAQAGLKHSYAYGNMCTEINGSFFRGHSGAIGGYLSNFQYNREKSIGYAFSINTFNEPFFLWADGLIQRFVTKNSSKPIPTHEFQFPKHEVQSFLGYYRLQNPNQLNSGFIESLKNTFKLEEGKNNLEVKILLGGHMSWKIADSSKLFFRNIYANHPHIALLKDNEGMCVITDNTMYFQKISAFNALMPIILIIVSIMILISSLVLGIISIVLFLFHKIGRTEILLRLSPTIASMGLLLIISIIPGLYTHMQECTPMNLSYIVWITGKYMFAIFTIFSFGILVYKWKTIKNKSLKIFISAEVLALIYTLGLFIQNAWYW